MHILKAKKRADGRLELETGGSFHVLDLRWLDPHDTFSGDNPLDPLLHSRLDAPNEIECDDETFAVLENAVECTECEVKALSLVARAEQSRSGLYFKLKKKGFRDTVIARVLDLLEASKALDDSRYAELWARSRRSTHSESSSKLYTGLRARGISDPDAKKAIKALLLSETPESSGIESPDEPILRVLVDKAIQRSQSDLSVQELNKLARKLLKKGFSRSLIEKTLKEYLPTYRLPFESD